MEYFSSQKYFMIDGRELFIDLNISINKACMLFPWKFHVLSFNITSSKFASAISDTRCRVR